MAGHQEGDPLFLGQAEDDLPDLHGGLNVQAVGGLVQNHQFRLGEEGQSQAHPLLHAQGELAAALLFVGGQAHDLQHPVHPGLVHVPVVPGGHAQVVLGREMFIQRRLFNESAHLGQGLLPVGHIGAEDGDGPLRGLGQAGDGLHDGGLPRTVGAQQPHHLPPFHGEGDVPGTPAVGVNLGEMVQGQYSVQGLYSFPQGSQRPAKGGRTPKATGLRGAPAASCEGSG